MLPTIFRKNENIGVYILPTVHLYNRPDLTIVKVVNHNGFGYDNFNALSRVFTYLSMSPLKDDFR